MCTYDYTPYTGCTDGEQHFYIQWMKCQKALENNKYCSRENSTEVDALRKLSTNVLSCPLHGPIAVQQYILNPNRPESQEAERSRPRVTERRGRASRKSLEEAPSKPVRRRRPAHVTPPQSSDSESSGDFSPRPDGVKRLGGRGLPERKSSMSGGSLHRRASSAELLPPARILPMPHGRSEVSLPLAAEPQAQAEDAPKQSPPKSTLKIPVGNGIIGLPSSPDMLHRARSESLLRKEGQGEPLEPPSRSTFSPASDSSPDHNPEQLPFSNGPARRGRRPGARSIRDRSVDTMMRRIDEHVVDVPDVGLSRASTSTRSRSSTTTSPDPQTHTIIATTSSGAPIYKSQDPRPRLHTLQIPTQSSLSLRSSPASAVSPPQQGTPHSTVKTPKSSRYGSSPASALGINISPQRNEETSSIHSRRFEDQVAEGRKWVAAREQMPISATATASRSPLTDVLAHMSETNLPLAPGMPHAGRDSVDSGYRSGPGYQHHRRGMSREVDASEEAGKRMQRVQTQSQGQEEQQRSGPAPAPAPLNLSGMPPCMLPISLVSPSFQPEMELSGGKGGKQSLRQRMGLRKKFSGMLWDRNGQKEVGVEG